MFNLLNFGFQPHVLQLTLEGPNTTIAEFTNNVDPDEKAHNESLPL